MYDRNKDAVNLERNLLRNLKAGEKICYYETKDGNRNRFRFDAVYAEYKAGYGFPVQEKAGVLGEKTINKFGQEFHYVRNNYKYYFIRSRQK